MIAAQRLQTRYEFPAMLSTVTATVTLQSTHGRSSMAAVNRKIFATLSIASTDVSRLGTCDRYAEITEYQEFYSTLPMLGTDTLFVEDVWSLRSHVRGWRRVVSLSLCSHRYKYHGKI